MRARPMERSNRFRSDHPLRFIIVRQPAVRRELVDEAREMLAEPGEQILASHPGLL